MSAKGSEVRSHRIVAKDLLRKLERMDWPSVDTADLASASLGGKLGPGKEAWEAFARYATIEQIRRLRTLLEYNPALFVRAKVTQGG